MVSLTSQRLFDVRPWDGVYCLSIKSSSLEIHFDEVALETWTKVVYPLRYWIKDFYKIYLKNDRIKTTRIIAKTFHSSAVFSHKRKYLSSIIKQRSRGVSREVNSTNQDSRESKGNRMLCRKKGFKNIDTKKLSDWFQVRLYSCNF